MRTGLPLSRATLQIVANCSSRRCPCAHIAGINPVFIERRRAVGIFRQQHMPVVMKIADDRHIAAGIQQPLLDFRHRRRRFRHVHGDAHQFRPRLRQFQSTAATSKQCPPYRYSSSTARRSARPRPPGRCPTFTPYVFRRGCREAAASNPLIWVSIIPFILADWSSRTNATLDEESPNHRRGATSKPHQPRGYPRSATALIARQASVSSCECPLPRLLSR